MNLHYKSFGTGPDMIFQHGLTANIDQVSDLFHKFEGTKIHAIDCPGHGLSPLNKNTFPSFNYYSDEVIRYMDNHKIKKSVLGGISMGSGISINIALRYPERVSGLVLVRPAWLETGNPQNLEILKIAAKFLSAENGKTEFMNTEDYKYLESQVPAAAKSVLGVFGNQQRPELDTVLYSMIADAPFEVMADLHKIETPCLIIVNEDDPLHPLEMGEKIYSEIKSASIYSVTSRYIDSDKHRTEVQEIIRDFMSEHVK